MLLMAVLIFSIPVMTTSAETTDAKSDARKDAKNIMELRKELRWFAVGCLGGAAPFIPMFVLRNDEHLYGFCCLLYGVGTLFPTLHAMFHSPVPPVERLLGKPPDYVRDYTDAYRSYVKPRRVALSAAGCITGVSIGTVAFIMLLPDSYYYAD